MGISNAPGGPGHIPHWAHADKDGVGAAFNNANRVWFTLWRGSLTEVFYPTVDRAEVRDLQLVVTDEKSFVHCEATDFESRVERLNGTSQAYKVTGTSPQGAYSFEKHVICDPDLPCVIQHYQIRPGSNLDLRYYVICRPHLGGQGSGGNAKLSEAEGNKALLAHRDDRWLAVGADCGFSRAATGFAGINDGLTDLLANRHMDFEFTEADGGNIVLTGEIPRDTRDFRIVLAFGRTPHGALTALTQSLSGKFSDKRDKYLDQWEESRVGRVDLSSETNDGGRLYEISCNTLRTHEDRIYPGAMIASLAIPWGQVKKAMTPAHAGYHLVWPRDAVNCAGAMLASGDCDTPLRTLTYLAVSQRADGSFAQNFWIDGDPNWKGLQLDEVTYPILLARKLHGDKALKEFNPLPMVYKAAEYIVHRGPITPQERWEQMSGYSPSTLAITIASMLAAAAFARADGKPVAAAFLEDYADWMRDHIERWTVTTAGELLPDCPRYIIRINPARPGEAEPHSPNEATLKLPDQPPDQPQEYPARNIVDAGFLELVRYGILQPDDPLIVDSLRVVDAVLKVETPRGPSWHRFNHDGYGQRDDGSPYQNWGKGRAWPLLTGERGHYALRAGQDVRPYIAAMECLSGDTGLIPEQVWDQPFRRKGKDYFGRPTGSANPLAWAHSEYVKLVRSAKDGRVFDLMPEVEERYRSGHHPKERFSMWTRSYPAPTVDSGGTLRIYARQSFRLRYTLDDWSRLQDVTATQTELSIHYADVAIPAGQRAPVRFTFYWIKDVKWNGCDYSVAVTSDSAAASRNNYSHN